MESGPQARGMLGDTVADRARCKRESLATGNRWPIGGPNDCDQRLRSTRMTRFVITGLQVISTLKEVAVP